MRTFTFRPSSSKAATFEASGKDFRGISYTLMGNYYEVGAEFHVKFSIDYGTKKSREFFAGVLTNLDPGELRGYRGYNSNVSERHHDSMFILRQVPVDIMMFRPSPAELKSRSKSRHLWRYAINYVLHNVRKNAWSWSYFRNRRENRLGYLRLGFECWDYYHGLKFSEDQREEYARKRKALTPSDGCLYRGILKHIRRVFPNHSTVVCDACGHRLRKQRVICLDCPPSDIFDWVDFCDHLTCSQKTIPKVSSTDSCHLPSHDLLKSRIVLHPQDLPQRYEEARTARDNARAILSSTQADEVWPHPSPRCMACHEGVPRPCWYCIYCKDFMCDTCEEEMHIRCHTCNEMFEWPISYFYSPRPVDPTRCSKCRMKSETESKNKAKGMEKKDLAMPVQHVDRTHRLTHTLVRLADRREQLPKPITEEKEVSLERQVETVIEQKLAHVLDTVSLPKLAPDFEERIVARVAESNQRTVGRFLSVLTVIVAALVMFKGSSR
ncbi:hypothetical protein K474DRAFT_1704775 [Panus rudis PR-1116 ss-1]|nr:hypothetical protein K474DRAFT_1704775 [Panus rudis PR-1116 ss-1]